MEQEIIHLLGLEQHLHCAGAYVRQVHDINGHMAYSRQSNRISNSNSNGCSCRVTNFLEVMEAA